MKRFFEKFDRVFPVREESQNNNLAIALDRAIYFFILLTAFAAPLSIAATNAGWVLGTTTWAARFLVRPRPRFWRTSLDFAIFGFWSWCVLSCFFSYAPDLSFDRQRVLTLFPIIYLVAQNVHHPRAVKFLAAALIFSAMITVFWTFAERGIGRGVQVFGLAANSPLARAGMQNGDTLLKVNGKKIWQPDELTQSLEQNETVKINFYRPDYYVDVTIDRANLLTGATATEKLGFERWERGRNWRSQAFYSHYTAYSEVLQLVMSLVLGIFVAMPRKISGLGIVLAICLAGMGGAMLLTATRASQAGFLLATLAIVATGTNRKVLFGVVALMLPLAVGAAIYLQQSRNTNFVDASDNSTTWRLTVWREGVGLLTKSPRHLMVGVGIDSIKRYRCEWGLFDNCTLPPGHFHSTLLQIAVECGLPALLFWLLIVFRYGRTLIKTLPAYADDWFSKGILLGAFGGLVGFFAAGFVHYNLGTSIVAMVFYLIMGLSCALVITKQRRQKILETMAI